MRRRLTCLVLLAGSLLSAADFQDGQAARAVIGQPSFSAHDKGIAATALSLAKGNLYVADTSGHLSSYETSRIGSTKTPGCPVCLVSAQSVIAQNTFAGVSAVAVHGQTVAFADSQTHRVLIWHSISPIEKPDVVLSNLVNPVSVALDGQRLFVGDAGTHHVFIWNALPTADGQAPDATLGTTDAFDTPGADTIETPSALLSDGGNLFVADSTARRVLVFSPADSEAPNAVNAATLGAGPFAPGTLVSISGNSRAATVFLNGNPLRQTDSDGDQVQFQIPYELNNAAAGSLWIKTESEDGSATVSRPAAVRFTTASPGIFAFGTIEPRNGLLLHAPEGVPLSPEDPAKPSELLSVWATGLGAVAPDANSDGAFDTVIPVRATLNGNPVEVVSAALPAQATGIYEVWLRLPYVLPNDAALVLLQNDSKSNAVTFPLISDHK